MTGFDDSASIKFVVILAIVSFVILQVGATVMDATAEDYREANGEIETVCNGIFGCHSSWHPLAIFPIVAVLAIVIGSLISIAAPSETKKTTDKVALVKEKYVTGDIETVLELEDRLEDSMEDNDEG